MRCLLIVLTATLLTAAGEMNLTVAQLEMFIRSAVELKQPDRQVAEYLRHVKMREKLDDRTIEDLHTFPHHGFRWHFRTKWLLAR